MVQFKSYKKLTHDYREVNRRIENAAKEIVKICIEDREQQGKPLSKARIRTLGHFARSAIRFGEEFNEERWARYQIIFRL